jgi:hypothetical protein
VYLVLSVILKNREVYTFANLARRVIIKGKVSPIPKEEQEPVAPTPEDTTTT